MPRALAELVELVLAAGLTVPGAKQPVGELLAIVASLKLRLRLVFGHRHSDLDRADLGQRLEEGAGRGGALVGVDGDLYPARGAVDGHEEIASAGLVGPLAGR